MYMKRFPHQMLILAKVRRLRSVVIHDAASLID